MMAKLGAGFVEGFFWKIIGLGGLAAAIAYVLLSKHFAGSVLLGTLVTAINFRVVAYGARKLLEGVSEGNKSPLLWAIVLGIKVIALFAVTYWSIVVLGADFIGFIIGYSVFIPAMTWQSLLYASRLQQEEEEEVDEESEDELNEADTERS